MPWCLKNWLSIMELNYGFDFQGKKLEQWFWNTKESIDNNGAGSVKTPFAA